MMKNKGRVVGERIRGKVRVQLGKVVGDWRKFSEEESGKKTTGGGGEVNRKGFRGSGKGTEQKENK